MSSVYLRTRLARRGSCFGFHQLSIHRCSSSSPRDGSTTTPANASELGDNDNVQVADIKKHYKQTPRSIELLEGQASRINGPFFPAKDKEQSVSKGLTNAKSRRREPNYWSAFRASPISARVDLSYEHPLRPKSHSEQRSLNPRGSRAIDELVNHDDLPAWFRSNRGLRRLIARWSKGVASQSSGTMMTLQAQLENGRLRSEVFDADAMMLLAATAYKTEDIITWSWILMAKHSTAMVRRYLQTLEEMRRTDNAALAHFMVLQILRANFIPADGFRALVGGLRGKWNHTDFRMADGNGIEPDPGTTASGDAAVESVVSFAGREWNPTASMLLLVRLLRHARMTAPDTLNSIVDIACNLLFGRHSVQDSRLSDYSNKLLKLLALPLSLQPMRYVHYQKTAQVRLLRKMISSQPEVPLNREGYRSLISVQLAHEKTDEEVAWARAKSLSWPPWREDKLGIDERLTYPGKESRAFKLLRRMNEAGFAHGAWENAAKIYTGWDTDNSPTIQTRKHLPVPGNNASFDGPGDFICKISATDPMIWAARVEATRSVREAWAAFLSYRQQIKLADEKAHHLPYLAMFDKLHAPVRLSHATINAVPGDGMETWPDSPNPQDVIYVPVEPPNAEELYTQMSEDGIQASGSLLSELVRHAPRLSSAVKYIKEGLASDSVKEFLLESYEQVEHGYDHTARPALPSQLLAAFIEHLMALPPVSCSTPLGPMDSASNVNPALWGTTLLRISGSQTPMIYDCALQGLLRRVKQHHLSATEQKGWKFFKETLFDLRAIQLFLRRRSVLEDSRTFCLVNELYHLMLGLGPWPRWEKRHNPLSWTRGIFARWVYGTSDDLTWISPGYIKGRTVTTPPTPYELRLLVETLGMFQDTRSILELIVWISEHAKLLQKAHRNFHVNESEILNVRIIARIFVERLLEEDNSGNIDEQLQAITTTQIDLPSREECYEFLFYHAEWKRRHRRYQRLRHSSNKDWIPTEGSDSNLN